MIFWERYKAELEEEARRSKAHIAHLSMALQTARQFDPQPLVEFINELATLLHGATRTHCHACAMPDGKHVDNCLIPLALESAEQLGWSSGE